MIDTTRLNLLYSPHFSFSSVWCCVTPQLPHPAELVEQNVNIVRRPTHQPTRIKVHSLAARVCLTTTGPTTDSLLKLPTRLSLETKVSTQHSMFLKRSCSTVASRKVLPIEGKSQNGKQLFVATTVRRGKPGTHFQLMCVNQMPRFVGLVPRKCNSFPCVKVSALCVSLLPMTHTFRESVSQTCVHIQKGYLQLFCTVCNKQGLEYVWC